MDNSPDSHFRDGAGTPELVTAALKEVVQRPLSAHASQAEHALRAFDLIYPELVAYRGGWFLKRRFHAEAADLWFESLGGRLHRVERMLNHVDLLQDYPQGSENEADASSQARALAEVLAYSWPRWAKEAYGVDITCRVCFDSGGEPATVTFSSNRPSQAVTNSAS